jgi:hypothetical protein
MHIVGSLFALIVQSQLNDDNNNRTVMILSTLFTAIALTGAPQPVVEQVSFLQSDKKIRINASAPVQAFGKKIRINGDMTGLDVLRAGKKIRISDSALKVEVVAFGKKIRI